MRCAVAAVLAAVAVAQDDPAAPQGSPSSVFEGLKVDLKTFTQKDSDRSALGLAFDYERAWEIGAPVRDRGVPVVSMSAALRGSGNVSFDSDVVPQDFSRVQAGFDGSWFVRSDPARAAADWTDLHVDLRLHGGFETNQEFTARNVTGGATAYVDLQAGPESFLARWNPFDLPFRLVRWLTDYERTDDGVVVVNGAEALPSFAFAVEHVETGGQDPRQQVGDTSDFVRLSAEVGFSAAFARIGSYHVAAEVNYRAFHEPGASSAVRAADLDFFDAVIVSLKVGGDGILGREVTSADGVFVSYRAGRLPFDAEDTDTFEVGFRVNF
jgi:hypothetical protein